MARTTDAGQLTALGRALGALGEKLPATQAQAGAEPLVGAMAQTTNAYQLITLGGVLG